MIIRKSTGMGTLYEQALAMKSRVEDEKFHAHMDQVIRAAQRAAYPEQLTKPLPHPLSIAVAAVTSRRDK